MKTDSIFKIVETLKNVCLNQLGALNIQKCLKELCYDQCKEKKSLIKTMYTCA